MDESLQELEAELKALQPRRPSAQLMARIEQGLAAGDASGNRPRYSTATNLSSWKWLGWRTAGLAAALGVLAAVGTVMLRQPPAPVAPSQAVAAAVDPVAEKPEPAVAPRATRYRPIAATNVLYEVTDEGPVKVEGSQPARRVRARYLDTYTWRNPATNASLKWSVPRDEIRVLPASLN